MHAILCFGDSIVQGRGAPSCNGWVQLLKEDFEPQARFNYVFNLGIPGDTTFTLLKRLKPEIEQRWHHQREGDRVVVLIGIGTNDAKCVGSPTLHETSPDLFKKNVQTLIEQAKAFTRQVAMVGLLPVDERLVNPYEDTWFTNERQGQYNGIINEVCSDTGVAFIDVFEGWLNDDYRPLLDDGLHPNLKGHTRLYTEISTFLKRGGLI